MRNPDGRMDSELSTQRIQVKHYDTVPVSRSYELHDEIEIPALGRVLIPRAVAHDRGAYARIGSVEVFVEPTPIPSDFYRISLVQGAKE